MGLNIALGRVKEVERTANGFSFLSENGIGEITCYTHNIIRVRISKNKFERDHSYAVISKPANVKNELGETTKELTLETDRIKLSLNKSNSALTFKTSKGTVINQDDEAFATSWIGDEVTCYKKIHHDEKFVGLGEKTGGLNRRGKVYRNWNTDSFAYGPDSDPLYVSIPFFIGIKDQIPYGIFLDNTHKTTFSFGVSNNRFYQFSAEDGEMNYYFIHHEKIGDIISSYCKLTGTMKLPPLWSLGYHQCRYSYYPESEILSLADNFRQRDIPADVLYLDIHYMDEYKVFKWNQQRFPDPKKLATSLEKKGFKLVLIVDPGIKKEEGYEFFEEGKQKNYFVKYPDGTDYEGEVWPGWSCFPDFTNPEVRDWWGKAFKGYINAGIEGYWNDMNEPAAWGQNLPDLIEFNHEGEKANHKRARNVYGMLMAKSTFEGTRKQLKNKRPFVLTRAGYAGVQRYSAVWTGDNVSNDEHMLLGVRLVNSLGLSGVSFAGYDIGGFVGECSVNLFIKWIQIGTFSPFFRSHTMINSRDAEPWSFGEEAEEICRNYIKLRYRLIPYIYSCFYNSSVSGLPINRSLVIDYHTDEKIWQWPYENQYMFGPNMLIIPSESWKDLIKGYLPKGKWYNFFTDELFNGNRELILENNKDLLPVYIKAGAIIPMVEPASSLSKTIGTDKPLEIHVYQGEAGEHIYYEDDGQSYDFEQGHFYKRKIAYNRSSLVFEKPEGKYDSKFQELTIVLHGKRPNSVKLKGKEIKFSEVGFSLLAPISAFDPFNKISRKPPELKVTIIKVKNDPKPFQIDIE